MTQTIGETRPTSFVGKAIGDLGALVDGPLVVVGDRLGLYRAMAGGAPVTPQQLADRTGRTVRYVRDGLNAQTSSGYVRYEGHSRYAVPAEHAIARTDESSPAGVIGGCQLGLASARWADLLNPHLESVEAARERAERAGVSDRVTFDVATAQDFPGRYDLVTFCDTLHDMGDPTGAAARARAALLPGGTLMVVEPIAGDRVEDNQNPVS